MTFNSKKVLIIKKVLFLPLKTIDTIIFFHLCLFNLYLIIYINFRILLFLIFRKLLFIMIFYLIYSFFKPPSTYAIIITCVILLLCLLSIFNKKGPNSK